MIAVVSTIRTEPNWSANAAKVLKTDMAAAFLSRTCKAKYLADEPTVRAAPHEIDYLRGRVRLPAMSYFRLILGSCRLDAPMQGA